jgi:hypothetical protein
MNQSGLPAVSLSRLMAANYARNADPGMCDKCIELDKKIEHYRQLAERVRDPLLTEGVGQLIEGMEAQKAALHPERQK